MARYKRKFNQQANGPAQQPHKKMDKHQNIKNTWKKNKNRTQTREVIPINTQELNAANVLSNTSIHQAKLDLSDFQLNRMLNFNTVKKEIILEGKFKGYQSPAIVILEKKISQQWPLLVQEFFNSSIFTKQISTNDVYGDYDCFPNDCNGWKMRIIHPASQEHLDKYARTKKGKVYMIEETYKMYEKITRPFIETQALSHQWVIDILNGKAEQNTIIFNDIDAEKGFVMLPDLKWDRSLENLDLLIISRKQIKSLRDLNETHLPLLKNIRDKCTTVMREKYGVSPSQFKMSVHYQPTYYHFHVLVSKLMSKNQGEHLLSTIIDNIEILPNYYQRAKLPFFMKGSHALYKKYKDNAAIVLDETEEH